MPIVYNLIALLLFALVYILGLIGNGLLIFIVIRQKHLRTVPNLLVVSLAFGDFLFVLFCVPFGAVAYAFEYYPFSTNYCRFENFIINLSLGVSIFSLLALSADRYQIIAKPFSNHAHDSTIKLKLVVCFIWISSAIFALPEAIYSGVISESIILANNSTKVLVYCLSPNRHSLIQNHQFMITRQVLRSILYYLMPLVFISVFYILIAKTLCQTKDVIFFRHASAQSISAVEESRSLANIRTAREIFPNNQEKKSRKQLQARHKVAKIVLFLSLVFFLCWLPKQIHDLYWYIGVLVYASKWNHFWQINKTLALILIYVYSCSNPFALYFLSSTFRHFYNRYLCFWTHRKCCSQRPSSQRRRTTVDSLTVNEYRRRSSGSRTGTTMFYDLNRMKKSSLPNYS